ncbi:BTAD domain-containing putative transcriptional regulator [Streptomyces sp. NPDC056503]|uniref:AfsR/SARP family transcriptional regulator n=1 Tax=Streptomyces sp. NPDC056503 TaxID=3345842 RepID=UPI0036D1E4C2
MSSGVLSKGSVLEIRILGSLEMRVDREIYDLLPPRPRSVLGALALNFGERVGVDYIAESVWEGDLPSDPGNQIAACVSVLRRTFRQAGIRGDLIATRRPGYELQAGAEIRVDAAEFRALQEHARTGLARGERRQALALFKSALGMWRGPVLSGMASRAWNPEIRRLEEERFASREQCSDLQIALGMHEEVVTELSPFVEEYPLLERPRAQLMEALAETGRQADALQLYRDTEQLLDRELGVLPGSELREMLQRVLSGNARSRTPRFSSSTQVRSRASEVAADASEATVSSRAVPDKEAPTGNERQGTTSPEAPCQLPGDIAEFVGRDAEIADLLSTLTPGGATVPVAVIVGPGGTGKTTLAVHTAHQLSDAFPDGQLYVNLGGSGNGAISAHEALGRFLRELGLIGPAVPESQDERAALLRSRLAGRRILLVLDNAGDARQVRPLLPGASTCGVLVTSRVRLTTLPNARIWELGVLGRAQADDLFARLAGVERVEADPEVARTIVDYCGRLPLAVRIIGAKLASRPHWSLSKAADRLADERRRLDELAHEGLEVRSTLELSHEGLSAHARRLFRRLALLGTADFAEWVCAPLLDEPLPDAEDTLEELLDARLVDVVSPAGSTETRYRLHDLVRLFAAEYLDQSEPGCERAAALKRATATALALTDLAHRKVCGGDYTVVHGLEVRPAVSEDVIRRASDSPLDWYERERTTVTALCAQAAEHDEDELAWDLAATSRCLFSVRFHFDEWQRTHEVALAAVRRQGNQRGEAALLLGLGDMHLTRRSYDVAVPLLERSRRLFAGVGDEYGHALALRKVAAADRIQDRTELALARWQECLPALAEAGDLEAQTQVLRWTAQTLLDLGAIDEAEEPLAAAERLTERFQGRSAGQVRLARADLAAAGGQQTAARKSYAAALEAATRLGDLSGRCAALVGWGTLDVRQGRAAAGQERLQDAQAISRDIQDPLLELDALLSLAAAHQAQGRLEEEAALLAEGTELCRRIGAVSRLERFVTAMTHGAGAAIAPGSKAAHPLATAGNRAI